MKRNIAVMLLTALSVVTVTGGCGKRVTEASMETESVVPVQQVVDSQIEAVETESLTEAVEVTDPDVGMRVIGTKSSEDGVFRVRLTNATGLRLTALSVVSSDNTIDSGNLLPEGEAIEAEETVVLYYDGRAVQEAYAARGAVPVFQMKLTTEDGRAYELSTFPFGDIDAGGIHFEEDVMYLNFVSLSQEKDISTKDGELARRKAALRKAEETPLPTETPAKTEQNQDENTGRETQRKDSEQTDRSGRSSRTQSSTSRTGAAAETEPAENPEPAQAEIPSDGGSDHTHHSSETDGGTPAAGDSSDGGASEGGSEGGASEGGQDAGGSAEE